MAFREDGDGDAPVGTDNGEANCDLRKNNRFLLTGNLMCLWFPQSSQFLMEMIADATQASKLTANLMS